MVRSPARAVLLAASCAAVCAATAALGSEPVVPAGVPSHVVGGGSGLPGPVSRVTFSREIVRILQARCQTCHREGGIAPFALETYADAFAHASAMAFMTSHRLMPPWHVDRACAPYKDDPSLTEQEIAAFTLWKDAGAPEGDRAALPLPRTFSNDWQVGPPDLALPMPEAYTPPFQGHDIYRCFVLPTHEAETRWVSSAEVLPGSRAMVHHVLLFLDTTGVSEQLDAAEPGPGYTCFGGPGFTPSADAGSLGGWVPGNKPPVLPDGVALKLPAGARVVMQVHYSVRAGVTEPDLSQVGLRFATAPVHKALRFVPIVNQTFRIPAGNPSYTVEAGYPFLPVGVHVWNVTPHMHLLGRTMRVEAGLPSGASVCMVDVPDWDFHWQGTYSYVQPVALPFGSSLHLTATYDNSTDNPENPNVPPRDVTWGESTTDEMCLAFLGVTLDYEDLAE